MFFNSLDFAIFLPLVFIVYWFAGRYSLRFQNVVIVVSSYIFYGFWDWRFLGLIVFSTVLDFGIGLRLRDEQNVNIRKWLLWASILVNLGFLGFFKYYNFFLENFIQVFSFFGYGISAQGLKIILPVGISFYTFQTLSYTVDVYRKSLEPTDDLVAFAAFVCFFPQLVAGPIERATNLLPQFYKERVFRRSSATDGMRQILWGLFKKVVIADNCAKYANDIFNNYVDYSSGTLIIGAILFAFQIYGDFSGYSDIAIGTSKLFGFNLKKNFATPYFSRDIAEFWRRWHISLSTWFRDYLYIPLGGSKRGLLGKVRNTFIIFLVSGFWHGASWTFVIWGGLNALYFLPLLLLNKNRANLEIVSIGRLLPSFKELYQMIATFCLTVLAWVFFRAESLNQAFGFLRGMCSSSDLGIQSIFPVPVLALILLLVVIEWINREYDHSLQSMPQNRLYRFTIYFILFSLVLFNSGSKEEFIYFQF